MSYPRESPSVPVSYFLLRPDNCCVRGKIPPWTSKLKLKFDIRHSFLTSLRHPTYDQSFAASRQHDFFNFSITDLVARLSRTKQKLWKLEYTGSNAPTQSSSNLVLLNQTPSINRKHGYLSRFSSQAQRYRCQARLLPQEEVRHHPTHEFFFPFLSFRVV